MAKKTIVKKANPLLEEEVVETATPVVEEEETNEDLNQSEQEESDTEETEEDEEEPVTTVSKPVKTVPKVNVANEMLTDIEVTKRALAKEPKVRIFIPLGIGEVRGAASAIETVTINGYRQVFKKGDYHTVPQSVADQIEQHYNMTAENTEAGMRTRLDHPRVQDGMSTDDALL